jgi:hypothetical protein
MRLYRAPWSKVLSDAERDRKAHDGGMGLEWRRYEYSRPPDDLPQERSAVSLGPLEPRKTEIRNAGSSGGGLYMLRSITCGRQLHGHDRRALRYL